MEMLREEGEVDELEQASFYFTHSHGHGTSWTAVHLKEEALRATCDTSEPQEVPTSVVTLLVPPPFYAPLQHIRTQLSDNIRCGPHITLYSFSFSFRLCFGSPRRMTLVVLTPKHGVVTQRGSVHVGGGLRGGRLPAPSSLGRGGALPDQSGTVRLLQTQERVHPVATARR